MSEPASATRDGGRRVACVDVSALPLPEALRACAAAGAGGAAVIARVAPGDVIAMRACLGAGCYYVLDVDAPPGALSAVIAAAPVGPRLAAPGPREALRALEHAEFALRTTSEAAELACLLAQLLPEPGRARLGLAELMVNAIEHGNLEIGGARKAELLRAGALDAEVQHRLALPQFRARRARVAVERHADRVAIEIRDEGAGFDFAPFLAAQLVPSLEPNGRGIALAHTLCFPDLVYRAPGNAVVVHAEVAA